MDINIFEELYQYANEEIRDINVLLNDYRNNDFNNKLAECEIFVNENRSKYSILEKEKTLKIKERNKINENADKTKQKVRLKQ